MSKKVPERQAGMSLVFLLFKKTAKFLLTSSSALFTSGFCLHQVGKAPQQGPPFLPPSFPVFSFCLSSVFNFYVLSPSACLNTSFSWDTHRDVGMNIMNAHMSAISQQKSCDWPKHDPSFA